MRVPVTGTICPDEEKVMNLTARKPEPRSSFCFSLDWMLRFLLICTCVMPAFGQEVKVFVSSEAGDRLTPRPPVWFVRQKKATGPLFRIMTGDMFQRIDGFGASFREAGLTCLNSLSSTRQESVLRSLFDPYQGAGFSVMSTPIAAAGSSSAGPNGLITYIRRARRYGRFMLRAAMDSPPGWVVTHHERNQELSPKYYEAFARYCLRYVQEYQRQGVWISYLSLLNESGTAGGWHTQASYPEIRDLLVNYIGPLFRREGIRTQFMLGRVRNPQDALKDYAVVLNDPQVRQYVAALSYRSNASLKQPESLSQVASLHRKYSDLPLWVTEPPGADTVGAFHPSPMPGPDFKKGAFWGNRIVSDIKAGASAWVYGNMIRDPNGGPRLVSAAQGDAGPSPQQPLIIIHRETGKVSYTGIYYYLAHFSKFVRPGAIRALLDGKYPGLRAVAFLSPDPAGGWQWVVELLNNRAASVPVQVDFELDWLRRSLDLTLSANSITTCVWRPLPHTLGNMPVN